MVRVGAIRRQRRSQHAAHLGRKVVAVSGLERVDLLLQQAEQLVIDARQRPAQPAGGEHQSVPNGVETQGSAKEPAVGLDVLRSAVGEAGLDGRPIGAAQAAHDVQHHGDDTIADLVGGLDLRLIGVEAERRPVAIDRQFDRRAAVVQMKVTHEAAKRRSRIRRVLRQQTHEPKGVQPRLLANEEPEVQAAGAGHAMAEEAATGGVGDPAVRVVEQIESKPRSGQYIRRICAQYSERFRNCQDGANADSRFVRPGLDGRLSSLG